ncbi:O-antigen ligase family protein [Nesterenkonia alba]|uniref:O-antigen ligase family protein n=1 Tax=Nesterenkonia alba TaxID=515814 RepID=UPI0003F7CEBE|nr:O-antigen ligase family protein [Nesterenkonia alba]
MNANALSADRVSSSDFTHLVRLTLYTYPLLWALGLGGLFWPLLGLIGILDLYRHGARRKVVWLPLGIFFALCLSSVIGVAAFGWSLDRIAGLFGNGLVWVALSALLANTPSPELRKALSKGIVLIVAIQGLVTAMAAVLYPQPFPLPLMQDTWGAILPSGIGAFATGSVYYLDWLGGEAFRSTGMMANATWAGAVSAAGILLSVSLLKDKGAWRLLAVVAILGGSLNLYLSLSRVGWAAFLASLVVAALILIRRHVSQVAYYFSLTQIIIFTIATTIFLGSAIYSFLEDLNMERAGSGASRGAIYAHTLDLVGDLWLPLLGYGVKPEGIDLVANIATHSAYIGMIFRGGLIGFIFLVALIILALSVAIRHNDWLSASLVAFVAIWAALEDLDVGHLLTLVLVLPFTTQSGGTTRTSPPDKQSPAHSSPKYAQATLPSLQDHDTPDRSARSQAK